MYHGDIMPRENNSLSNPRYGDITNGEGESTSKGYVPVDCTNTSACT
jgi:hypothetical protein